MNVAEAVKEPLQTPMEAPIEIPQGKEIYLFVCSGNTCRSPMAAALFNHYYGSSDRTADSAGLYADGAPLSQNAARALELAGITPPENHVSKTVDASMLRQATQVIGITAAHADSLLWSFPQFASKITKLPIDIPDPYGGDLEQYQKCLEKIKEALSQMFGPADSV